MDINQSSLSRYKANKSDATRSSSEAKSVFESSKQREVSTSLSQSVKQPALKEGQIVQGQIIDHRFNEVKIQLEPDQQVITAKLTGNASLSIGQNARFQVTEEGSDKIILKYIPSETAAPTEATIQKALSASGLPMTDRNKAIVEELLNHRMPIDKQTLQTLIKLSHTNREASPLTLVLMFKNKIPMTQTNIKQFESYQNGTHQLLNDIRSISKNIADLLKHQTVLPETVLEKQKEVIQMNGKIIDILFNNSDRNADNNLINPIKTPLGYSMSLEELSLVGKFLEQQKSDNVTLSNRITPDLLKQISTGILTDETSLLLQELLANDQKIAPDTLKLLGQITQLIDPPATLSDKLLPIERNLLLDYIATFPDTENIKGQIAAGTASFEEVLTYLSENLTKADQVVAEQLLQAPVYQKLLEEAFLNKWTITPKRLASKDSVSDLYKNLQEDLDKLDTLQKISKESTDLQHFQEPAKNMKENLQFMKDLNEVFNYLQIPIQFKDYETHSDLYVFARKKTSYGAGENPSVLLHLDMANLGPLNVLIKMDYNKIHANFYFEDATAGHLIDENLPTLTNALQKKGYHLVAEVKDSYQKPDFSKDFIEEISQDNLIQQYTFDIRT